MSAPNYRNINKRYEYAGHCIYCGNQADSEEHIIPKCFDGKIIIENASCPDCRDATSAAEGHCITGMLETARDHIGLKGRRRMKNKTRFSCKVDTLDGTLTFKVPKGEHPSAIIAPVMNLPDAFNPDILPQSKPVIATSIISIPVVSDIDRKIARLGGAIHITRGLNIQIFCQMLAKVAYAYAFAESHEIGWKFTPYPYLIDIILGRNVEYSNHYIGGSNIIEGKTNNLHELGFLDSGDSRVIVKIRLLSCYEMPSYYVVAGLKG